MKQNIIHNKSKLNSLKIKKIKDAINTAEDSYKNIQVSSGLLIVSTLACITKFKLMTHYKYYYSNKVLLISFLLVLILNFISISIITNHINIIFELYSGSIHDVLNTRKKDIITINYHFKSYKLIKIAIYCFWFSIPIIILCLTYIIHYRYRFDNNIYISIIIGIILFLGLFIICKFYIMAHSIKLDVVKRSNKIMKIDNS